MRLVSSTPPLAAEIPPLTLGMGDVARILSVSRGQLVTLIKDPAFPRQFLIGQRKHVLYSELEAYVQAKYRAGVPTKSRAA